AVRHATRTGSVGAELVQDVHHRAERREAVRGVLQTLRGRRLRLALLLPRRGARPPGAGARVWRRRQAGGTLQGQAGAARGVPGPLGPGRLDVLRWDTVPRALSRRRIHRVSRLLEPRAAAAGGLPGSVRAVQERQAGGRLRDVRGRLLEGGPLGAEAPAGGRGGGAGRIAVYHRRRGRDDLAGDVQRAVEGGKGVARAAEWLGTPGSRWCRSSASRMAGRSRFSMRPGVTIASSASCRSG